MRSLSVVSLAVAALIAVSAPAAAQQANRQGSCSPQNYLGNFTPAQALAELGQYWGQGVTLSTGSEQAIISAFRQAMTNNSSMTSDMAEVIAAGRPELLEQLRRTIGDVCPAAVPQVMQNAQQAANNPTPDQLASIAQQEGSAPAAGGEGGEEPGTDPFDPALNDPLLRSVQPGSPE